MSSTVAYFKNGIGNWVLMTPALQALASQERSGAVDIVIDADWKDSRTPAILDLIRLSPFIGKMIMYPTSDFNTRQYTRWFFSRHSEGSQAYHVFESKCPSIGHRINWITTRTHEVDYYMNIVRERFGYTGPTPRQYVPQTEPPPSVREALESRDLWVAICNGSFAKMRGPKCWPMYKQFADAVRARYGASIVGVGGTGELRGVKMDLDLTGELTITATAKVLSTYANYFVTTDTGLMHIADALRVPSSVLFGGSLVSKNGPVNHACRIVRADEGCIPCQYVGDFEKCKNPRCMAQLSVGRVLRSMEGRMAC